MVIRELFKALVCSSEKIKEMTNNSPTANDHDDIAPSPTPRKTFPRQPSEKETTDFYDMAFFHPNFEPYLKDNMILEQNEMQFHKKTARNGNPEDPNIISSKRKGISQQMFLSQKDDEKIPSHREREQIFEDIAHKKQNTPSNIENDNKQAQQGKEHHMDMQQIRNSSHVSSYKNTYRNEGRSTNVHNMDETSLHYQNHSEPHHNSQFINQHDINNSNFNEVSLPLTRFGNLDHQRNVTQTTFEHTAVHPNKNSNRRSVNMVQYDKSNVKDIRKYEQPGVPTRNIEQFEKSNMNTRTPRKYEKTGTSTNNIKTFELTNVHQTNKSNMNIRELRDHEHSNLPSKSKEHFDKSNMNTRELRDHEHGNMPSRNKEHFDKSNMNIREFGEYSQGNIPLKKTEQSNQSYINTRGMRSYKQHHVPIRTIKQFNKSNLNTKELREYEQGKMPPINIELFDESNMNTGGLREYQQDNVRTRNIGQTDQTKAGQFKKSKVNTEGLKEHERGNLSSRSTEQFDKTNMNIARPKEYKRDNMPSENIEQFDKTNMNIGETIELEQGKIRGTSRFDQKKLTMGEMREYEQGNIMNVPQFEKQNLTTSELREYEQDNAGNTAYEPALASVQMDEYNHSGQMDDSQRKPDMDQSKNGAFNNFYGYEMPYYDPHGGCYQENATHENMSQMPQTEPNFFMNGGPPEMFRPLHQHRPYQEIEQPLYVNAHQFNCIRRRKLRRDFLDSITVNHNNLSYLHESRHRHAMNRLRAPSGRFLTKEEAEEMRMKEKEKKNDNE